MFYSKGDTDPTWSFAMSVLLHKLADPAVTLTSDKTSTLHGDVTVSALSIIGQCHHQIKPCLLRSTSFILSTSSLGSVMLWVSPSFVSSFRHDDCLNLLYQAWFLDDGVLAGTKSSLLRALTIIQDMGPSLCQSVQMWVSHYYVPGLKESLSLSQRGYPWCSYC